MNVERFFTTFLLLFIVISSCCFPGKKNLGKVDIEGNIKSFSPYMGKETLIFKNQKGELLKFTCQSKEDRYLQENTSLKNSCAYYMVQNIDLKYASEPEKYIFNIHLAPSTTNFGLIITTNSNLIEKEHETRYFSFPLPLDSICFKKDSLLKCYDTLTLNKQFLTDIYKIKTYDYSNEIIDNFQSIYYSKTYGIVRFKTYSGDDYFLINNPIK